MLLPDIMQNIADYPCNWYSPVICNAPLDAAISEVRPIQNNIIGQGPFWSNNNKLDIDSMFNDSTNYKCILGSIVLISMLTSICIIISWYYCCHYLFVSKSNKHCTKECESMDIDINIDLTDK